MSSQLTQNYDIPDYAQDMLYIGAGTLDAMTPLKGKHGDFVLPAILPEQAPLQLIWGSANGPTLAYWRTIPSLKSLGNLKWDGRVHVGGFIERIHAFDVEDLELIVAEIIGGVFPDDYVGLPTLADMRAGRHTRPPDQEPLRTDQVYTFLVESESHFAALLHDALIGRIGVDVSGALAPDEDSWHHIMGLPLLLDTLTLIAP